MTNQEYLKHAFLLCKNETANKKILAFLQGLELSHLYSVLSEEVNNLVLEDYLVLIKKYQSGYPLAYIIGNIDFYGNNFVVNESVLIPRMETAELVEETINRIAHHFPKTDVLNILDIGTGSGAIAISLKLHNLNWLVSASDISQSALLCAEKNAQILQSEISFLNSDIFENIPLMKFDVIISNPPYISQDLQGKVDELIYEPSIALFGQEEGLSFYKKIIQGMPNYLNDKFLLAFEIGFDQKEKLENLLQSYSKYHYEFLQDSFNNWRFLFIWN